MQRFIKIKTLCLKPKTQQMTQKFTYDGYTICVTFRSENALTITASYNITGEHFINDMAELGKIKKDTVIATLARKSQKNLWCTFKMVDSQPRKLVISFIVKFDFLPEFSEDIVLEYMQIKGEVLNKISSAELQSDIDQIDKVLEAIKQKGAITVQEKSSTVSKQTLISEIQLCQGSYLLQVTGFLTNAAQVGDSIQFIIDQEGEEALRMKQKTHSQYGYGYPFFVSQKIDAKAASRVKISATNSQSGTATISNQIITLIPIVG